eukprot:CAMPEP_0206616296 /NCGR_PEP_ID=MMETSP0325_2-20121206/58893_1 /ASSEMBLY_ACC=CAM_ASM_000347 /TAXON_ID=2866 /ORGANISM="Crypthecodinium cohnii, Strain Seligo" /LENGTH=278 /DNA_ID=CAMNT_0054137937 /DNA_START=12 /DNA_END=849 /DNA_ORIENTATION=+
MPKRKLSAMDELRHLTRKQESLRIARQKAEIRVALDQDPSLCADILDFLKNRGVVIGQDTRALTDLAACCQTHARWAHVPRFAILMLPEQEKRSRQRFLCVDLPLSQSGAVLDMATAKATPLPAEEGIKKTEMRALDKRLPIFQLYSKIIPSVQGAGHGDRQGNPVTCRGRNQKNRDAGFGHPLSGEIDGLAVPFAWLVRVGVAVGLFSLVAVRCGSGLRNWAARVYGNIGRSGGGAYRLLTVPNERVASRHRELMLLLDEEHGGEGFESDMSFLSDG